MNTKLIVKTFFALVVFTVIFLMGFYISAANQFIKAIANPRIESETEARNRINRRFNLELPENATRLYYAGYGFVDSEDYAAFSLSSTEECKIFIGKQLDVKLEDFKEIAVLPDDFIKYGPDTWGQYRDPVWNLRQNDKYLLCTNSYYRAIIYAPKKHRFYFRLR